MCSRAQYIFCNSRAGSASLTCTNRDKTYDGSCSTIFVDLALRLLDRLGFDWLAVTGRQRASRRRHITLPWFWSVGCDWPPVVSDRHGAVTSRPSGRAGRRGPPTSDEELVALQAGVVPEGAGPLSAAPQPGDEAGPAGDGRVVLPQGSLGRRLQREGASRQLNPGTGTPGSAHR